MTGPTPPGDGYYRPAEVAKKLRCSEWWVKEQARKGRIPYSWLGGKYVFTEDHVAEIAQIFEHRPAVVRPTIPAPRRSPERPTTVDDRVENGGSGPNVRLTARVPRRVRTSAPNHTERR